MFSVVFLASYPLQGAEYVRMNNRERVNFQTFRKMSLVEFESISKKHINLVVSLRECHERFQNELEASDLELDF